MVQIQIIFNKTNYLKRVIVSFMLFINLSYIEAQNTEVDVTIEGSTSIKLNQVTIYYILGFGNIDELTCAIDINNRDEFIRGVDCGIQKNLNFNHLKKVDDADANILSKNEYDYKQ